MRDFRDAKAMAQTLRAALAAKGVKISVGESLELIAKSLGAPDWNTLSAAIRAERPKKTKGGGLTPPIEPQTALEALRRLNGAFNMADLEMLLAKVKRLVQTPDQPSAASPASADEAPQRRGTRFSPELEASLHRAVAQATQRKHSYTTLEHLLLSLLDDNDAAPVMEACLVDRAALGAKVIRYVDEDLKQLIVPIDPAATGPAAAGPAPTAGFHRVVQRAVIHVQANGRPQVTGANLLVAIFSEVESHACLFLSEQGMTRYDAVNFMVHGIRKGGAAA